MLPSELKEDEWIKLTAEGGSHKSCIAFHVYYSELFVVALHPDAKANDTGTGLMITNDLHQADAIYSQCKDSDYVTEERGGRRTIPSTKRGCVDEAEWSETVKTGVKPSNDD
jgi:hypothetical protein